MIGEVRQAGQNLWERNLEGSRDRAERRASWSRGRGQRSLLGLVRAWSEVGSKVGPGRRGRGQENGQLMGGGQKRPWRTTERGLGRWDSWGGAGLGGRCFGRRNLKKWAGQGGWIP